MKSIILRSGLLACVLLFGWSYQASAEMTLASKCTSFGELKPNQNPTSQQINCLLTNAALEANIPPEVVKAVAMQESGWKQFDQDGQPLETDDGGIGIMQITNQVNYDQEKLKTDITYNIQAGVEILNSFYKRKDLPKIKGAGSDVIENWYFPVMAYNGIKPVNSPLYQLDGSKNTNAYQEKVFAALERDSFLSGTKLAGFPFKTADFSYQTDSDENMIFNKLEYTITTEMHESTHLFEVGEKVVTTAKVNLRSQPDSRDASNIIQSLETKTTLVIDGNFVYDEYNQNNRFVWYPVKTDDGKVKGYISSAYLVKKLEAPVVSPVLSNHLDVIGKTPIGHVTVIVMRGSFWIGSTVSDVDGNFKVGMSPQLEGEILTVTYKDGLNRVSDPTTIKVQPVLNGWIKIDGELYHYTNGYVDTGWYREGKQEYYLDPSKGGALKKGWLQLGENWLYLDDSGTKTTGWLRVSGSWYYFASNGLMATGWLYNGGVWYYLASSGAMKTGWVQDGRSWYYLASSGAMKTGWLQEGRSWYYLASSGEMKTGWQRINGTWYYFYSSGVMAYNTWIGGYRLGSSGAMM
ncbi:MAG: transglycosylase SLT domain-containing protein [Neobacillus sp.]